MNCNMKQSELTHCGQSKCDNCYKMHGCFCYPSDANKKAKINVYTKPTNMTVLQCLLCKEVIILHCNEKTVDHQCFC